MMIARQKVKISMRNEIPIGIIDVVATAKCESCHYWGELSEPHTSELDGTSDRLQTITMKHGKLVYSI